MTTQRSSEESSARRSLQLSLGRTAYLFFIPSLQIGADGPRSFNPRLPQPGCNQFHQPIIHPKLILNFPVSKNSRFQMAVYIFVCLCVCVCVPCICWEGQISNVHHAQPKTTAKHPLVCVTRRDDIHTSLEPLHFATLLRADTHRSRQSVFDYCCALIDCHTAFRHPSQSRAHV